MFYLFLQPKRIELDTRRLWPPVTFCCFTHNLTSVTYQGPTTGGGQEASVPRGVMLFATTSIPRQAAAFYWELELCLIAEGSDVASVAMGYSFVPPNQQEERQQAWQYPHETCLIRRLVVVLSATAAYSSVCVHVCVCVCVFVCL